MTTGITGNYGYNPYLVDYYNNRPQNPGLIYPTTNTTPIFRPTTAPTFAPTQQPAKVDNTEDGKDDGKIGFWGALKNIGKGIIKTITSPFTDEQGNFSIGKTLKSLAIGAAIALIPGGTAIALAAGVTFGAIGVGKAAYNIATAKTDAEDEAAWQSLGGSATVLAASVYGAKQYGSAQAGESVSAWKGVKSVFSDSKSTITSAWKSLTSQSPASLWNKGVDAVSSVKSKVTEGWNTVKQARADWKAMTPEQQAALKTEFKTDLKATISDKLNASGLKDLANTSFKDMFSKITNIAKNGIKNGRTAVSTMDPSRQALVLGTFGVTGRTNHVPAFYNMLSAQEQVYFDSLPEEQKQALIDQYYAVAA